MPDNFEAGGENEIEYEKLSTCDLSNVNASCVKLGMSIAELVQNKHLWSKSVELFIYFFKWPIVLLEKSRIPWLRSCRALWSCIETNLDLQLTDPRWSPLYGEKS